MTIVGRTLSEKITVVKHTSSTEYSMMYSEKARFISLSFALCSHNDLSIYSCRLCKGYFLLDIREETPSHIQQLKDFQKTKTKRKKGMKVEMMTWYQPKRGLSSKTLAGAAGFEE